MPSPETPQAPQPDADRPGAPDADRPADPDAPAAPKGSVPEAERAGDPDIAAAPKGSVPDAERPGDPETAAATGSLPGVDRPGAPDQAAPPADPLLRVAVETERYVSGGGWDQPPRLFALVPTGELTAAAPHLTLGAEPGADDLSAVEQEGFDAPDLQRALAGIAWPEAVAGVALALERVVVPPEAERDLPEHPEEAMAVLAAHPGRRDVRLLVAVHRDGRSSCVLRQRAHDRDELVATGPDLATGLVAALAATLTDDQRASMTDDQPTP